MDELAQLVNPAPFVPGGQLERALGQPPGPLGCTAWPAVLDGADAAATPADGLPAYVSLQWSVSTPPPEVSVQHTAVTHDGGPVVLSVATVGERQVAKCLTVYRCPGGDPLGFPVPPLPAPAPILSTVDSVVLDAGRIAWSQRQSAAQLHTDPNYARRLGYPEILVRGVALLAVALEILRPDHAGVVEMWCDAPVPVGTMLLVGCAADRSLLTFSLPNGCSAATVALQTETAVPAHDVAALAAAGRAG